MQLIADLHVHSRFSRATSQGLTLAALHRSALEKGIGLVGTGDFTHPGWLGELQEQLEEAEDGLFRLNPELSRTAESGVPPSCRGEVRFVLQVEISNIYRKGDRTRKNHNLVFVPSFAAARRLCERLASIGNLAADGRPILGLDARDLLEITLETDPLAFMIPAHVWTPWFSLLGSKSGFDSLEECFGDLSHEVFAVETGLSSDPPMNWRLSQLDRLTLVSNSDAHSPAKLGREANLLDIDLGYEPLLRALKTRDGFLGTLEFYPEEGKYHLDGHRKCALRSTPEETKRCGGRCPTCGSSITVGVSSRVQQLADRLAPEPPLGAPGFTSLVPLAEVVAEVCGTGPATKRVAALLAELRQRLGPELFILRETPLEEIRRIGHAGLAEAVRRVRAGEVVTEAGYDGAYGTVRVFRAEERAEARGQLRLAVPPSPEPRPEGEEQVLGSEPEALALLPHPDPRFPLNLDLDFRNLGTTLGLFRPEGLLDPLEPEQRRAASWGADPLLIVAGPGTGKTRTLVSRMAHLLATGVARADEILAVTFTNQAAEELKERVSQEIPHGPWPRVTTFHGFGRWLLSEYALSGGALLDQDQRLALIEAATGEKARAGERLLSLISLAKQSPRPEDVLGPDPDALLAWRRYEQLRAEGGLLDVDDLVLEPYRALRERPSLAREVAGRFRAILVDEFQDVNDVQVSLLRLLSPSGSGLSVIGDPDQAIYGFRGAKPGHFHRFAAEHPSAGVVRLTRTYRLTRPILEVAQSVSGHPLHLESHRDGPLVEICRTRTAEAEAERVVTRIEQLVGGSSLLALDTGAARDAEEPGIGFGDVAVLSRTKAQHRPLVQALASQGLPCRVIAEDEPHDPRSQKIAIMTLHAAKGRQFEVVFIVGAERGLLPLEVAGMSSDPEEERRLLYVGVTRAKRRLVISHARRRYLFGATLPGGLTQFLADVPPHAVTRVDLGRDPRRGWQLSLFR